RPRALARAEKTPHQGQPDDDRDRDAEGRLGKRDAEPGLVEMQLPQKQVERQRGYGDREEQSEGEDGVDQLAAAELEARERVRGQRADTDDEQRRDRSDDDAVADLAPEQAGRDH